MSSFSRPTRQKRRNFGNSWWGNAWVGAVEQLSDIDQSRLARGRTYARWGYVGTLTVEPGVIKARVAGSRPSPYHTYVKIKTFTDAEWDALFDVVASKVAHAAALIDNELTSQLVDDAHDAGIELLPTPGDITTGCSCPDDANPCKHSAAVCYLVADLLDDDPFTLLQVRGRTHPEVITALRSRRRQPVTSEVKAVATDEVLAKDVFNQQSIGSLPALPKAPAQPGTPAALPLEFPISSDIDPADLEILAQATAQRAWEMCHGIGDSGLKDTDYLDLIRRLAPFLDTPEFAMLCSRTHLIKSSIERDARLWVKGGLVAMEEAESTWYPEAEALEPAIHLLESKGSVNVRNNRVTCKSAGQQLRLGESGRWYAYELHGTQWRFVDFASL